MKTKPKKINGHTLPQFIAFLNETLIPDLKKSGTTETAKDFESAVKWIEFVADQHGAALAMLKKLRDSAVNTPALDSSKDWTDLITEADRVLAGRVKPAPDLLATLRETTEALKEARRFLVLNAPDSFAAYEQTGEVQSRARTALAKALP